MKRVLLLLLSFAFLTWGMFEVLQSSITTIPQVSAQSASPEPPQIGGDDSSCKKVGNNLAVPFGGDGAFREADTLALVSGPESKNSIIGAINASSNTVVVRFGSGTGNSSPMTAEAYADMLIAIARETRKPFVAQAGRNEANCAEYVPIGEEVAFTSVVARRIAQSDVADLITVITGQIDHYCGAPKSDSEKPADYIRQLTAVPGIEGLALPYYITDGTPTAENTYNYFHAAASLTSLPVYITESGPFKVNSMDEFIKAVPLAAADPQVKLIMLFNALGINKDSAFGYTRPFWNINCREALRTRCTDIEYVKKVCGTSVSPEEYYIQTIKGLADGDYGTIFADLADQGYQAACSSPKVTIEAMQGADIGRFIELRQIANYPGQKSTQRFDYSQVRIPLLRDEDLNASLYNSLEDFYGFQALEEAEEDIQQSINSAPAFALMDLETQCKHKVKVLEAIEKKCTQLANVGSCALYQSIPGADTFTTQTLLDAYRSQGESVKCENVYESNTLIANLDESQKSVVEAIQKTPIYLEKMYRLAFLVVVTDLMEEKPGNFFNFLRADGTSNPSHDVKVIAFKIPDFGTNKYLSAEEYVDPLQTTRNLLLEKSDIDEHQEDMQEYREQVKSGSTGNPSPGITCSDEDCRDPLIRALVEIVNRTAPGACDIKADQLQYEPVNQIFSNGNLKSSTGTQFSDGSDPAGRPFENSAGQVSPQAGAFNFLSNITLGLPGKSDTQMRAFLVAPYGQEAESIELSLLSFFSYDWAKQYLSDPPSDMRKYLKLDNATQEMAGAKITHRFYDPQAGVNNPFCRPNQPGYPQCLEKKVELEVVAPQDDAAPRIPFGGIGYLSRKIQQTLHMVFSPQSDFLATTNTTEEWLLRSKAATQSRGVDPGNQVPNSCEELANQTITVPTQAELVAKVRQYATAAGIRPELLWGILQIEGGPLLRAMRSGQTTLSCRETINTCGATGPMQIIQGVCVQDSCRSSLIDQLRRLDRPSNICSVDGSLQWAAQQLGAYKDYSVVRNAPASNREYLMAGLYTGLDVASFDLPQCKHSDPTKTASPISGCNGLNYCQCAVDGWTMPN